MDAELCCSTLLCKAYKSENDLCSKDKVFQKSKEGIAKSINCEVDGKSHLDKASATMLVLLGL